MFYDPYPVGHPTKIMLRPFDGDDSMYWHWNATGTQWVQLQLPTAIIVSTFVLAKRDSSTNLIGIFREVMIVLRLQIYTELLQ